MNANSTRPSCHYRVLACAVVMVLGSAWLPPAAAAHASCAAFPAVHLEISAGAGGAPGIAGRVHRMATRTERAMGRFWGAVSHAAVTWGWVLASAALFLFVTAIASVTDLRMLDPRGQSPRRVVRDLVHGVRTFFRLLRDRHTPYLARSVLVLALLYWLLPADLVSDDASLLSTLDDLVIAIVAAKLFIHLCPDAVVAKHATAVRAGA